MKHIINRKVFIIAFHAIVLLLFLLPVMQSCKKLDFERVVRIKTGEISNKTTNSATATGFIQDVGEDGIIQYGHCWSINQGPTVNLETKTVYGSRNDTGSFESDITGLSQSTIYYIRAYATNSQGTAYGDQVSFTIDGNEPFAAFTASPTTISAGQTVNFTDQSANDPTTWSWDFGDGGTSTDQNPSYIYSTAGTYTVILTATNGFGSDSETKS
ncbi:MAG: PKD domain-containing protein, partial [Bacteroidales bacterium]|nr:PKD domain-containing protein [Bacteroidales bacterium]